jgi:hypothetical protein
MTLSRRAVNVVHEFSDMDEMPNSQGFLAFVRWRMLRGCGALHERAPPRLRCADMSCAVAMGAPQYTFP